MQTCRAIPLLDYTISAPCSTKDTLICSYIQPAMSVDLHKYKFNQSMEQH